MNALLWIFSNIYVCLQYAVVESALSSSVNNTPDASGSGISYHACNLPPEDLNNWEQISDDLHMYVPSTSSRALDPPVPTGRELVDTSYECQIKRLNRNDIEGKICDGAMTTFIEIVSSHTQTKDTIGVLDSLWYGAITNPNRPGSTSARELPLVFRTHKRIIAPVVAGRHW